MTSQTSERCLTRTKAPLKELDLNIQWYYINFFLCLLFPQSNTCHQTSNQNLEQVDIIKHMSKNPIINAVSASGYIVLVVGVMSFVSQTQRNKPDTFFAPITLLSLLTLSVAVMAFLFFYQPLQLFIEGKKKEAVSLFVKTVGIFAAFTAVLLILLFSGLI